MFAHSLRPGPWPLASLFALTLLAPACRVSELGPKGEDDPDEDASDSDLPDNPDGCESPPAEVPYNGIDDDCDDSTPDDDLDGDGYDALLTGGQDCDDSDRNISPSAQEVCDDDDEDEDCDGLEDDDDPSAQGQQIYYEDDDRDGFGGTELFVCDPPRRYATVGGDCDDSDSDINPDAQEKCDSANVDEDCDGLADDDDPDATSLKSWYPDADGDGHGANTTATRRCDQPAGTSSDHTDCDDSEALTSPDYEHEICGDGVPNTCDLSADEAAALCALSEDEFDLDNVGFTMTGASYSVALGSAVSMGGDHDGDGYDDVLIGDPSRTGYGGAYLFSGPVIGDLTLGADALAWQGDNSSKAGASLALSGDLDGDGLDDLLVGEHKMKDGSVITGGAWLLYGPATAGGKLSDWDLQIVGETTNGAAGTSVDAGVDLDGDGIGDLIIGDPLADGQDPASGLAAVFYGPLRATVTLSDADALLLGERTAEKAGSVVSLGGDTDGDGYNDLLLSAPGADRDPSIGGISYLVRGPVSSLNLQDADARFGGEVEGDRAGVTLSLGGDADGDGFADLLIGSDVSGLNGKNAGTAWLVLGPMTGKMHLSFADARIIGASAGMACCSAVEIGGDVDGDGRADLLIGDPIMAGGFSSAGRAHLFSGAVSGDLLVTKADTTFNGHSTSASTGAAVALGGDLNGDGFSELLIGAPGEGSLGTGTGAAWLVQGGGAAGPGI